MNKKLVFTIFLGFIFAISMTSIGFPFASVTKMTSSGGIGTDFHIMVTFLNNVVIDFGHYGWANPQGWVFAFVLNFGVAFALSYVFYYVRSGGKKKK